MIYDSDDVIPESILSLAKDARYISQCQIMLQQAFNAFLVVREQQGGVLGSSGSGEEEEEQQQKQKREILMRIRKQTTWYISFILYICLVVIPTGRTLGMEACGLTFSNNDVVTTTTQTQPVTTTTTTTTTTSPTITTRRNCSIVVGLSLFLAAASGLIREYYSAASIRTSSEITNNNNNNDNNNDNNNNNNNFDESGSSVGNQQQQQQEQLRGRERNMMHERLRRQMLERAKSVSASASASANSSCDGIVDQNLNCIHGENITARRVKETSSLSSSSKRLLSIFQRLSDFIFDVTSNSSDGPHDIVQINEDENSDNYNLNNNNINNNTTSYSMALWLIRLHLAQYLLTGKYPTLMHRFLDLIPVREKIIDTTTGGTATTTTTTTTKSKILSRPNTNRAIAFLILLQASTSLIQTSANWFTRKIAYYLESRALSTNNKNLIINTRSSQLIFQKKLDLFFNPSSEFNKQQQQQQQQQQQRQQPSEHKSEEKKHHHNSHDGARLTIVPDTTRKKKKKMAVCTICRRDRIHPAAPSSCGHVCCWNCLIQWVSTVRPECPLCRSPCKAQDIIALHNYDPVNE